MQHFFIIFVYILLIFTPVTVTQDKKISDKTVMIFGVFDLLHEGHESFIEQALEYGSELIIVVTQDHIVRELKKKEPCDSQTVRINRLQEHIMRYSNSSKKISIILGDAVLGQYHVIKQYKPDIVCLGYDQQGFGKHLQLTIDNKMLDTLEIVYAKPYKPEIYHTSLILKSRS